ncbi:insulinase family protein [Sphingobacterium kitahiroshimense]|uniref:M16 family metallopeptidase n=1 Tax=Sphingobacterium sp. B16(2022) TaxID=2914044 RepID=UPI0014387F37|nr:M16 family metallopeptidase [Sphingobacterium sp. B16(2022)]NJI72339.1 insulinase family protein [Sphingobacterium sp. B16(2022)]
MHLKQLLYLSLLGFSPVLAHNSAAPGNTEIVWTKQSADTTALPLDKNVRYGKLTNGLTYYIRKNTEPQERVFMYLVNKVGSILENEQQRGLAHFLEHMAFNGTTHYPNNALVDYLQKNGISFGADINAYTSFNETVYQLQLPSNDSQLINNGFQILQDWAQGISLDHSEIDKERGVILEEKRAGKSLGERIQDKTLPVALNHSLYAERIPIGTEQVIQHFPYKEIESFYKNWYRPNLQAIIVVGDIDVDKTEQLLKKQYSTLKNPAKPTVRPDYKIPLKGKNQFLVVTDPEITSTSIDISIKFPEKKLKSAEDFKQSIIRALFNDMMANRYNPIFRTANPPFLGGGTSLSAFMGGLDVFQIQINAKPGRLKEGFDAVWREIFRVQQHGFTTAELQRAKDSYLNQIENIHQEKDKISSSQYVDEYIQHFLNGIASPGIDHEVVLINSILPTIGLQDIQQVLLQNLKDTDRDITVLAPEQEKAQLPDEATFVSWISALSKEKTSPYAEQSNDQSLLTGKPQAGTIVKEVKDETLGTTTLTLSNNIKVTLKPTNFQNNQISFQGFSYGGTSLYNDQDFQSANNAVNFVGASGLGNYTADQFEKSLAGRTASASSFITETAQGVGGFSNNKDLELALEMMYGYFTEPRLDTTVIAGILDNAKDGLKDRDKNGDAVFQDSLMAILSGNNIRRTGLTIDKINQINPQRAFEIYKERFSNASGYNFTFVGSFDIEKIKPLIATYIGGLPSTGNQAPTFRNLNINIPAGKIEKKLALSKEDKAMVYLILSGGYDYNAENNIALQAFREVLEIRLLERLREEEGGVYSPSIQMDYNKIPDERYTISVGFSCSVANADKLAQYSLEEIEKLKNDGPSEDNLNKFKTNDKLSYEAAMKTNDFWSNYLYSNLYNGDDMYRIFNRSALRDKLNQNDVKNIAKKFVSDKNVIKIVQLPEANK